MGFVARYEWGGKFYDTNNNLARVKKNVGNIIVKRNGEIIKNEMGIEPFPDVKLLPTKLVANSNAKYKIVSVTFINNTVTDTKQDFQLTANGDPDSQYLTVYYPSSATIDLSGVSGNAIDGVSGSVKFIWQGLSRSVQLVF